MASRRNKDLIEYIDDNSQHEDDTPFIPVRPETGLDTWTTFFGGILIAICGGALLTIAPWLGGAFVAVGYCLAAYSLRGARSRFAANLRFAFLLFAMLGAVITTFDCLAPRTTWSVIEYMGRKLPIFIGIAILPWVFGTTKYLLAVIWPSALPPRSRKALSPPKHSVN